MKRDIIRLSKTLNVDDVRFLSPAPLIEAKKLSASGSGFERYTNHMVYAPEQLLNQATCIILLFKRYTPVVDIRPGSIHVSEYYKASHALYLAAKKITGYIKAQGKQALQTYLLPIKHLALRGGGFIGKNGFYHHPEFGSLITMQAILTQAAASLKYPVGENRCNGCRICIEACPSGAVGEYGADLKKCLRAGLNKVLDERLRKDVYQLFGCEKCQTACSLNRPFAENRPTAFQVKELLQGAHVNTLKHLVGGNAAKKKRILSQTVLYAANTNDIEMIPLIRSYIRDPAPFLSEHAIWAVKKLERKAAGLLYERNDHGI